MKRSDLLSQAVALGLVTASAPLMVEASTAPAESPVVPLATPPDGVAVAFLLADGAVPIDFAGPWEVFMDARVVGRLQPAFNLYTVAETRAPVNAGGLSIVPNYTFADAPAPKVIVVPAQSGPTASVKQWLSASARSADLIMSVCTGALILAEAGLLDGYAATTHHSALTTLAMHYPNVSVVRGVRFVDDGKVATSAGLSAGIDLALHVVARYCGKETARLTAYDMEYQSNSWMTANNTAYLKAPIAQAGDAICPVCWMEVDPKKSPTLSYRGATYYFCMPEHEKIFAAAPQRFLSAIRDA
ncbi:MAG: DJ-1/PfpI family protein [Candidatus Cybelea sp.]|jgi:transcriptional regulator GlxA family with amidase domain/YHS domain-containing protein